MTIIDATHVFGMRLEWLIGRFAVAVRFVLQFSNIQPISVGNQSFGRRFDLHQFHQISTLCQQFQRITFIAERIGGCNAVIAATQLRCPAVPFHLGGHGAASFSNVQHREQLRSLMDSVAVPQGSQNAIAQLLNASAFVRQTGKTFSAVRKA